MRLVAEVIGFLLILFGAYWGGREILSRWHKRQPTQNRRTK